MSLSETNDKYKEKLRFYEIIQGTIFDGIIILDKNRKIILCNKACENILDSNKKDIINKDLNTLFENKLFLNQIKNETKGFEHPIILNNKKILLKYVKVIDKDEFIGSIIILKDITNEINLKMEIEKKENYLYMFERYFTNVYNGMVIVDENGVIKKWGYEELLGLKEEEVLNKNMKEVVDSTRFNIVVKTGKMEIGNIHKYNGKEYIGNSVPVKKDGKVIGAIGTVTYKDINEIKYHTTKLKNLENELKHYKNEINKLHKAKYFFEDIITNNSEMKTLKNVAIKIAKSDSNVSILGESGTGKELFAQAIHNESNRKYGPFIAVNCAAIPKDLLESELFGYEEGAFTGSKKGGKLGKFELANGGTIFLDELHTLSLEMQAKLLRVLEERELVRIGGNNEIQLDIRVITATNENLEELINKGKFREDLYYRLNIILLKVPPLRDRLDDIPILSTHITSDIINKLNLDYKILADDTIRKLQSYDWPGNVRQLRNVIERALNIVSGEIILPVHLPEYIPKVKYLQKNSDEIELLKDIVTKAEIKAIKQALIKCNGNRSLAAKILGIHRTALYKKLERFGLDIKSL